MSKQGERIEIRMCKEEIEALEESAKKLNMNKSAYIKMLIRDASKSGTENICDKYMMDQLNNISDHMFTLQTVRLLDLKQDELMEQMLSDTEIYYQIRRFFSLKEGKLVCNSAGKFQLEQTKEFLQKMVESLKQDPWAFVKEELSWIGQEDTFSENNSLLLQKQSMNLQVLDGFLNQKKDTWMNKVEQEDFCDHILSVTRDCSLKIAKGARIPKKNLLNKFLSEYGLEFEIVSKPGIQRGEETLWQIVKRT